MDMRYTVQKAEWVEGDPIPDDEPCLVIRAQDVLAIEMIDYYIRRYEQLPDPLIDQGVIRDLEDHRDELVEWQHTNPPKVADR